MACGLASCPGLWLSSSLHSSAAQLHGLQPICIRRADMCESDPCGYASSDTRNIWSLGILLQRGNAAILGNRVPTAPAPLIDGVM